MMYSPEQISTRELPRERHTPAIYGQLLPSVKRVKDQPQSLVINWQ